MLDLAINERIQPQMSYRNICSNVSSFRASTPKAGEEMEIYWKRLCLAFLSSRLIFKLTPNPHLGTSLDLFPPNGLNRVGDG